MRVKLEGHDLWEAIEFGDATTRKIAWRSRPWVSSALRTVANSPCWSLHAIVSFRGDRTILVKLVVGDLVLNVISAYAPQVGHNEREHQEGVLGRPGGLG